MPKTYLSKFSKIAAAALASAVVAFPVFAEPNLNVEFSANPSSGSAPLQNVDLTAHVSGTATGPITYKFDCTSDGSWEKTVTTNEASYTAADLCDYNESGNYRAKVSVGRGGLFFEGTTAILVSGPGELKVELSANPSSGQAPLENVDLTATVSGTNEGNITYRFDCTSDGTWDKTVTSPSLIYTANDLCTYNNPGNYTAKVKIERGGLSFEGTASLAVYRGGDNSSNNVVLQVTKLGRNLNRNQTSWQDTVDAGPGDRLAFKIEVRNAGNGVAKNVMVSDVLPSQLIYGGNFTLEGVTKEGNVSSWIDMGDIPANGSKILTFEVQVKPAEEFQFGVTSLSNVAVVKTGDGAQVSDAMLIRVQKTGVLGATTTIPTGAEGYVFAAAFALTIAFAYASLWYLTEELRIPLLRRLARKYSLWKSFVLPRR